MQKRLQSNTGLHAIKASTPFEPLVTCGALNYNPSKSCQQTGQIKVIVAPTRCKPASKFRVSAQKAPLPSSPTNNRYKNQTLIKVYPPDSLNSASKLLKTNTAKPASTESPHQQGLCPKGTPSLALKSLSAKLFELCGKTRFNMKQTHSTCFKTQSDLLIFKT